MSLLVGAPAPLFAAPARKQSGVRVQQPRRSLRGPFVPAPASAEQEAALTLLAAQRDLFRDDRIVLFNVLSDDVSLSIFTKAPPWLRWFDDRNGMIRALYGAVDGDARLRPQWIVVDPSLRVLYIAPLEHGAGLLAQLRTLGEPSRHAGVELVAPVLIVPRVLEPRFLQAPDRGVMSGSAAPLRTRRRTGGAAP